MENEIAINSELKAAAADRFEKWAHQSPMNKKQTAES